MRRTSSTPTRGRKRTLPTSCRNTNSALAFLSAPFICAGSLCVGNFRLCAIATPYFPIFMRDPSSFPYRNMLADCERDKRKKKALCYFRFCSIWLFSDSRRSGSRHEQHRNVQTRPGLAAGGMVEDRFYDQRLRITFPNIVP